MRAGADTGGAASGRREPFDARRSRNPGVCGPWLAGLAIALLGASAVAAELAGVTLEDRTSVGGRELVRNGAGVRTRAIFKVYVASLYVPAKADTLAGVLAQKPRRVRLDLVRNLSAAQLVDALLDGLRSNTPEAELASIRPQVDQLVAIMTSLGDVREGNAVTLDFVDGETRVALNGELRGIVPGEAINQALLRIWLGERPVQVDLKKAMLGG